RNSSKALLPRDDVVQCIEARALALQGWPKDVFVERLWAQRYGVGGHYTWHYDWSRRGARGEGRVSSFMVFLGDACEGGGTAFPRVRRPGGRWWCGVIECGGNKGKGEEEMGVTFKPIAGSAVYWENFKPGDEGGWEETWHAGLPVTKGEKVGLNIWSWYQP
ncbi:hypothetical protein K402DRAFT_302304, partial [Aulographum hederae CBS 113979]